jgi:hypothetical protein
MTPDKIKEVVRKYKTFFTRGNILPVKHDDATLATDVSMQLQHCHWMVIEIEDMIFEANQISIGTYAENLMTKCNRWLGFIQGVLWAQSICSIEDLKGDNRNGTTDVQVPRV